MTKSTIKEELDSAKYCLGQAMKELAKHEGYNESGKAYVVQSAQRNLQDVFQRIHRAMLLDEGKHVEVPR